jgi:hypothetical protein
LIIIGFDNEERRPTVECFAWKLKGGVAYDEETAVHRICLVELAESAGGDLIGFVLYRRVMPHWQGGIPTKDRTEMIRLQAKTAEEAIRRFWPERKETGREFPGFKSPLWKPVPSFNCGAVCDKCEQFRSGTWVPIKTPAWARPPKRRKLQFGNLADTLLVLRLRRLAFREGVITTEIFEENQKYKWQIDMLNEDFKRTRAKMRQKKHSVVTVPREVVQRDWILRLVPG